MKVEVLEKTDTDMRLVIREADTAFMNTLRRTILAEVPSMAVEEVVFIENSSVLKDEILAHRLGLIPLRTDLSSYNLPEECTCKSEFGCSLCRVTLTLDVDAGEDSRTVYSGDLRSEDPAITPVSENIPVVKLAPHQKIKLEAYAQLGRGKEHAKWQPVCMCTYRYWPEIRIDKKKCDACGECVEVCPKKILVNIGKKIEIRDQANCTLCKDCMDACPQNPPAVEIDWKEDSFIFSLESTGALPPEKIMFESLNILNKKSEDFVNQLIDDEK
jgi:DNA-directed RNA polymerase subunit D